MGTIKRNLDKKKSTMENLDLKKFFKNKKIFITGHSGFKGTWLTFWLKNYGAKVCGVSLKEQGNKYKFFSSLIDNQIENNFFDISNIKQIKKKIDRFKPEIFFHLASQPLVIESYKNPMNTIKSNVIGLNNILEILRKCKSIRSILIVTSDKCYKENKKGIYDENSCLGGNDPYSASKAIQEILTHSFRKSFFEKKKVGIATVRAGNIFGGCDFSKYRLIPDIIRSIYYNKKLVIRNPNHLRPWQFISDVTFFYILLSYKLYLNPKKFSGEFNLSPDLNKISRNFTVKKILNLSKEQYPNLKYKISSNNKYKESKKLLLINKKTKKYFSFRNKFKIADALKITFSMYNIFYKNKKHLKNYIIKNIINNY